MKKILTITYLIFLLSVLVYLQAQNIMLTAPSIVPLTPEAAAVEKYASYPVSHTTGIPEITVPLHEIKVGDIVLPISLSYHSAGLKPNELSGWAGTGWTLNAIPSIVRNIQGLPDNSYGALTGNNYGVGYLQQSVGILEHDIAKYLHYERLDGEPDIYSYKLANTGGTCIPNKQSSFSSFPLNDIKIIYSGGYFTITEANGIQYKMGTNINYTEQSGDFTIRWLCQNITSATTSAKINFAYSGILERELDNYNLSDYVVIEDQRYGGENPVCYTKKNNYIEKRYITSNGLDHINTVYNSYTFTTPSRYRSDMLKSRLIECISFDNGSATFEYVDNWNLGNIEVRNNAHELIKRIDFFITPYNSYTSLTKLDSVVISAPNTQSRTYSFIYNDTNNVPYMDTKAIDHWGFANGENGNGNDIAVPTIDLTWLSLNISTTLQTIQGRNREANATAAKRGMLNRIINPEGIETEFIYEGNQTAYECTEPSKKPDDYFETPWGDFAYYPIGGLRIKQITETDTKTGKFHTRLFKYGYIAFEKHIEGAGIPKRLIKSEDYCFEQYVTNLEYYQQGFPGSNIPNPGQIIGNGISRIRTWGSMPLTNITFRNGSAILYSYVEEQRYGSGLGQTSTKYYYTAPEGIISYNSDKILTYYQATKRDISIPFEAIDASHAAYDDTRWGLLKKVEHFKADTLVSATEYKYMYRFSKYGNSPFDEEEYDNTFAAFSDDIGKYPPYAFRYWDPYYLIHKYGSYNDTIQHKAVTRAYQSRICALCEDTEFKSGNGNYYTVPPGNESNIADEFKTVGWNFAMAAFPVRKDSTTYYYDNGKTVTTAKQYKYNLWWQHPYPVQTIQTNSDGKEQKDYYRYAFDGYSEYSTGVTEALQFRYMKNTLLEHKKVSENDSTMSIAVYDNSIHPKMIKAKMSSNDVFNKKIEYHKFDYYGNPVEISDDTGMRTCYLWGYSSQYPIAKIENISYSILLSRLGKNDSWVQNMGTKSILDETNISLINTLRNYSDIQVHTYKYKPLIGVISYTDPRGVCTEYEYDGFGRLIKSYIVEGSETKKLQSFEYHIGE